MAGSGFNVVLHDVHEASANCQRSAGEIETYRSAIHHNVDDLLTRWMGQASRQYDTLMAEFDTNARSLHRILEEISQNLTVNAVNYDLADEDARGKLTPITVAPANF